MTKEQIIKTIEALRISYIKMMGKGYVDSAMDIKKEIIYWGERLEAKDYYE